MRKYRLRIGLDVDDTLYQCNAYALELLRKEKGDNPLYDVNRISMWGKQGNALDERLKYFGDPAFVRSQPLYEGAQAFVHELAQFADVFFITAVPPDCMSARAKRLCEDFPEVPTDNILIGTRKDIVDLDVLLDDGAHNIATSRATYPVLLRRPWNNELSGLLSVNGYADFVHLVQMIADSFVAKKPDLTEGGLLCLVGATGTGKTEIAQALVADSRFYKPVTTTTRERLPHEPEGLYRHVDRAQFLAEKQAGRFIETTVYGTHFFGTTEDQLTPYVAAGKIAVVPIDICGAVTFKNLYRGKVALAFCTAAKPHILANILARRTSEADKINRLMSLDIEMRNMEWCDFVVDYDQGLQACLDVIYREVGLRR
jgi:guanylate kinase